MELKGKVIAVFNVQSGVSKTGNEWKKQEFLLETQENYPKKVCFTLFNKLEQCPSIGEEVVVHFDIDSHEYNGRWYNQVTAWKVEKETSSPATQQAPAIQGQQPTNPAPSVNNAAPSATNVSDDDIPF